MVYSRRCYKGWHYQVIDMDSITDAGAHNPLLYDNHRGEHKSVPLYNKAKAVHYGTEGVYMNHTPGGAFRGYGATEALWPLEMCSKPFGGRNGNRPSRTSSKESNCCR